MTRRALNERDLRALRIFRVAAQAKGFAAAEKLLGMTKATISRQISAVEDSLGCRLCIRGPGGFELTPDGTIILRYAEDALDALDRIIPAVEAGRGIISGPLTIGMSDNVIGNPASFLQQALDELCRVAPDVSLTLHTMPTNSLIGALMERKLDIVIKGIHEAHPRVPDFSYLELFEETHRLYYVKKHDETQAAAAPALPVVYRASQPFVEEVIDRMGYRRGPEAIGMESVAMLVGSSHYAGILPTHYAEMLSTSMPLVEAPRSPTFRVKICAVTNTARPLPIAAQKMLALLRSAHGLSESIS